MELAFEERNESLTKFEANCCEKFQAEADDGLQGKIPVFPFLLSTG